MRVLITGANRGIGAALANEAIKSGHQVIGTCRNRQGLNPAISWLELDLTAPESISAFSDKIARQPLDAVVCNAGVYPDKGLNGLESYSASIWDSALSVNVTGVALTIQAALPSLLASKGKIAVLSSIMASSALAPGGSYAYRASKAAVTNLARNLATDLRSKGVAVGSYHPGWVKTDMGGENADISVDEATKGLWQRIEHLSIATSGVFESYNGTPMQF